MRVPLVELIKNFIVKIKKLKGLNSTYINGKEIKLSYEP